MDIPKTPLKNRSQNFKPKIKENYPQYLERENKNCFICGDSFHCARDCEKRFKPKESNDHIHNRINVNTLKIESEKQNSDEFANLQYVNIFVENQPVTALIDSGCQIPILNSSLIRVQTPSEEIITLSSCFGEQSLSVPSFLYVSDSPLVSMKKEKRKTYRCGQRTVRLAGYIIQWLSTTPRSLRVQAQQIQTRTETMGLLRRETTTEVREQP
ncbi:hypothetical protein TNCV_3459221 [Trichonephila clavipes]|nr:hypothetical protein TNCV_3459221 [Trichonephila clavipes]